MLGWLEFPAKLDGWYLNCEVNRRNCPSRPQIGEASVRKLCQRIPLFALYIKRFSFVLSIRPEAPVMKNPFPYPSFNTKFLSPLRTSLALVDTGLFVLADQIVYCQQKIFSIQETKLKAEFASSTLEDRLRCSTGWDRYRIHSWLRSHCLASSSQSRIEFTSFVFLAAFIWNVIFLWIVNYRFQPKLVIEHLNSKRDKTSAL